MDLARVIAAAAAWADDYADAPESAFPIRGLAKLREAGLLAAALSPAAGGCGLGSVPGSHRATLHMLREVGRGSLVVGRLFEGHVNALQLIEAYGTSGQVLRAAADVRAGHVFGVWNTQAGDGVHLEPLAHGRVRLHGAKTFASGAGRIARPVITGTWPDGGWQLCVVPADTAPVTIDRSFWQPLGMEATDSARVDFTGVELEPEHLLGVPGDYYRQPLFSGGAIRFCAVQLGGAVALLDHTRRFLRSRQRTGDPWQQARLGRMAAWVESGNCLLDGAAAVAEQGLWVHAPPPHDAMLAYANLLRVAVEELCLRVVDETERAVGARGLLRPCGIEQIVRDLSMYLRQPAPDAALADLGRHVLEQPARFGALWSAEEP